MKNNGIQLGDRMRWWDSFNEKLYLEICRIKSQ